MIPTQTSQETKSKYSSYNSRIALVGGEVGCLTLIIVLGAVFGGLWLDRVLGTKPVLTIILLLGSAPLSLVLTFWIAMRAVKGINLPPPSGGKTNVRKEEEDW